MKLLILAILFTSIFALNSSIKSRLESEDQDVFYTFSSPAYYSASPVFYSYTPASYYYSYDPFFGYYGSSYYTDYTYVVYPFYYRGAAPSKTANTKEKKEATKDDLQSELTNLKKEIWSNENFDTSEIRKSNKAYDSRWLIAQLKITRALELEDNLKKIGDTKSRVETDEKIMRNITLRETAVAEANFAKNTTAYPKKVGKKNRDDENLEETEEVLMETEQEMRKNKTKVAAAKKDKKPKSREEEDNLAESEEDDMESESESEEMRKNITKVPAKKAAKKVAKKAEKKDKKKNREVNNEGDEDNLDENESNLDDFESESDSNLNNDGPISKEKKKVGNKEKIKSIPSPKENQVGKNSRKIVKEEILEYVPAPKENQVGKNSRKIADKVPEKKKLNKNKKTNKKNRDGEENLDSLLS